MLLVILLSLALPSITLAEVSIVPVSQKPGQNLGVRSLDYGRKGRCLASVWFTAGQVRLFKTVSNDPAILDSEPSQVLDIEDLFGLTYSPNSRWLAVTNQCLNIYKASCKGCLVETEAHQELCAPFSGAILGDPGFSPDGRFIAVPDPITNQTIEDPDHSEMPQGNLLVFSFEDGEAKAIQTISTGGRRPDRAIYSPDGEWLAVVNFFENSDEQRKVALYSVNRKNGKLALIEDFVVEELNCPWVNGVAFSPDSNYLAVAAGNADGCPAIEGNGEVLIYKLDSCLEQATFVERKELNYFPYDLAYRNDHDLLFVTGPVDVDGTLNVLESFSVDTDTGEITSETRFTATNQAISSFSFPFRITNGPCRTIAIGARNGGLTTFLFEDN